MSGEPRIDAVALRAGHVCPECGCECYAAVAEIDRLTEARAAAVAPLEKALREAAERVIREHGQWRRNTAYGTGEPEAFSEALLWLSGALNALSAPSPVREPDK